MADERDKGDDSTRFVPGRGADDETRFTGVGAPGAAAEPQATFPPGSVIGHTYRIDAFLARGGMGEVYRARHVELNTDHALKIILPELANNQRSVDLFRREAAVLRTIRHDAVVAYDGVFRDENGRLYLVMEFADGPSLSKQMRERPLGADEVRRLRDRLADGLAVAHEKGVIHRDISPDNVILPGGDLGRAKIIDFGISKMADPEAKTIVGDDFAGKFSYVSPEQLGMFGGQVDGRSDIYSLGLVLAAAAIGEPLDMGVSPIAVIEARRAVPDLGRVPAAVRAELAAMLQPDPADRPQSMGDLVRSQEQRGGRRSALSEPSGRSSGKPRSGRMGGLVGALAVLVVAGGVGGYWYSQNRGTGADTIAQPQQPGNGGQANSGGASLNLGTEETPRQPDNGGQANSGGASPNVGTGETPQQPDNGSQVNTGGAGPDGGTGETPQQPDSGSQANAGGASSNGSTGETPQQPDSGGQQSGNDTTPKADADSGIQEVLVPQVPDVAKLRSDAKDAVQGLGCASIEIAVSEQGDVSASGYVAAEADRDRVTAALQRVPAVARVDNTITVMKRPICEALDVLREGTAYNVATAPRIDPGGVGGVYRENDHLKVTVTAMSDGYLYVDYVDAKNDPSYVPKDPNEPDKYVLHLLPNSRWRTEERRVKAGEKVVIGTLKDELDNYTMGPPFDTYVFIAICSPERLFDDPRPVLEPAEVYLPALRDRLAAVARRVGRENLPATWTTVVVRER